MAAKSFAGKLSTQTRSTEAPSSERKVTETKRGVGRPKVKNEDCKTINIAIPVSMLEQMQIAKIKYGDNLTKYVNEVISKDLEANMETYKQIYELLKQ